MNEEGYVFITDRFSDMIVSGGVNIYPAEAEQVLMIIPRSWMSPALVSPIPKWARS